MRCARILDLTTACFSFPEFAADLDNPQLIHRDNNLDTIKLMLDGDTQLVTVEGEEGIGKTTLLAQFALNHPNNAISLFVKQTCKWGYDPEVIRYDLCNQINIIISKTEIRDPKDASDAFLRNAILRLTRFARTNNQTFYFVIDGLDEINDDSSSIRDLILDMIPFGIPQFRFILTGDFNNFYSHKLRNISNKAFPLSGFTLDETVKFFSDINGLSNEHIKELYLTCKKNPGHLSTVKKMLITEINNGANIDDLVKQIPAQLRDLFELEWEKVDNEVTKQALAIIAHDNRLHNLEDISQILGLSVDTVSDNLSHMSFVCIDENMHFCFESESFRKFTKEKLSNYRDYVNHSLIDHLLKNPDSDITVNFLPNYLEQAGKYQDILNYLSPDHFTEILHRSQSLYVLMQKAELGIKASNELKRDNDLMRFCIQRSIVKELQGAQVWRSEIEALMSIDDYDAAISLAQSMILKEDRLHLLAIISKKKYEKGLQIETELIDEIKNLYSQIDKSILKEQAIEIASDLIYTNAELAINLVIESNGIDSNENSLDQAFAKLTFATLNKNSMPGIPDSLDTLASHIKDPSIKSLSNSIKLIIGNNSAVELIANAEKLENTSNRLFMLRQWILLNKKRADAAEISDYALKLAIKTSAYAPNASVLRELALPLPYIADKETARNLIGSFDSQKATIEQNGPTEDFIRLQLLLAFAESKYDFDAAATRVIDIYLYIDELDDISIKTVCLARLLSYLDIIDPEFILESKDKLHSITSTELESNIRTLLETTADHFNATRNIIRALAKSYPNMAFDLAKKLNTVDRRNQAFKELITCYIQTSVTKLDLKFLSSVLDSISDTEMRSDTLIEVLERLSAEETYQEDIMKDILSLAGRVYQIQSSSDRCIGCCHIYTIASKSSCSLKEKLLEDFMKLLESSWLSIDVGWYKVNIGYKIVSKLAPFSLASARKYFESTENLKKETTIDSEILASNYVTCLKLTIRAYTGLLYKHLDTKIDFERIKYLINQIPSDGVRCEVWADIALRYYINRRYDDCKHVVNEHVKPLMDQLFINEKQYWSSLVVNLSPALYCSHKTTTFDYIQKLDGSLREYAYYSIGNFILQKCSLIDPYYYSYEQSYDISYEDIIDICEIIENLNTDNNIYYFITCLSNSIYYHKNDYTQGQKNYIASKLCNILDKKLPDPKNIRHEGYRITSEAYIYRFKKENSENWNKLIERAKLINNSADRAFVYIIIATCMPGKELNKPRELLKDAKTIIDELPSISDRIEHYETFASMASDIDISLGRECIHSAMKLATRSNNPEMDRAQRSIIDLAYRMDPDLASSLSSLVDNDEARIKIRHNMKKQLRINEIKDRMANRIKPQFGDKQNSDIEYANAAWKSLSLLNAGRVQTLPIENLKDYIGITSNMPLKYSYPILSWIISNIAFRYSKTAQANTAIRPLFEAIMMGSELSLKIAEKSTNCIIRTLSMPNKIENINSYIINPNEREYALELLRDWIFNKVDKYLKICDPYFSIDDLEILQIVNSVKPNCSVYILTGLKQQKDIPEPISATYRNRWRKWISEQNPPDTEIIIVGTASNKDVPIHDRWWISENSGLRIGTSFNSLGLSKSSEISYLNYEESREHEKVIDQYIYRSKRDHNGEKLIFETFTL